MAVVSCDCPDCTGRAIAGVYREWTLPGDRKLRSCRKHETIVGQMAAAVWQAHHKTVATEKKAYQIARAARLEREQRFDARGRVAVGQGLKRLRDQDAVRRLVAAAA